MSTNQPTQLTGQLEALRSRCQAAEKRAQFADVARQLSDISSRVLALPGGVRQVRGRGYVFAAYLEGKVETLARHWDAACRDANRTIDSLGVQLRLDMQQAEGILRKAEGVASVASALAGVLPLLEREVADLEQKAQAAETRVKSLYEPLANDIAQTEGQLREIGWIIEQRDEASFTFQPEEAIFLAAKAEWVASGKGKDDPDGILFLTDRRLIFEQKETVGKTLGLFGGKQVQEVEWDVPLSAVAQVRAENKGLFGGKDMLTFTLGPGARFPEITVEVKGGATCKFWAAQVQRMAAGQVQDERMIAADSETLDALRAGPAACPVCGATILQTPAGIPEVECVYCGARFGR